MKTLQGILLLLLLLGGCSHYKSSWDYPNAKGVGGSSVEYADEVARQKIVLNTGSAVSSKKQVKHKTTKKSVLINKHRRDFEDQPMREGEF